MKKPFLSWQSLTELHQTRVLNCLVAHWDWDNHKRTVDRYRNQTRARTVVVGGAINSLKPQRVWIQPRPK